MTTAIETRSGLAVALDVRTLDQAEDIASEVAPWFGVAKVGLQLFSGYGPAAVERIADQGLDVFLDVKLHDIPNTVAGAARQLGRIGARYVTVHAAGGVDMIRAAVDGLAAGADDAGLPAPIVLGVTVLTSMGEASGEVLAERVAMAIEGGAGGLVCAVPDLVTVAPLASGLLIVCPGIRMAGGDAHDQARIATPSEAIEGGAGLLVVGRAVTGSDDRAAAAAAVAAEIEGR